jgi:hypothetical protein
MIVDNPGNSPAAVKGTFIFQRKGPRDAWEDLPREPLTSLKKGECYSLALDSAETLELFQILRDLYQLHSENGIPVGETVYIRARGALKSLSELNEDQLREFLKANIAVGGEFVSRLLSWAAEADDVHQLVELLERLGPTALGNLNTAVSVGALTEVLHIWKAKKKDSNEEFWHQLFAARSFILEQLFSWPCTIIANKAYVGGKTVENRSGHIVDFLVRNQLTASAALVEIKTPVTPLTGKEYRAGIPNVSAELSGAVIQALFYKASLNETYLTLRRETPEFDVFDPPCVVIIGNSCELTTTAKKRSLELFRRQFKNVEVVTFDELFGRIERLVTVLNARDSQGVEEEW